MPATRLWAATGSRETKYSKTAASKEVRTTLDENFAYSKVIAYLDALSYVDLPEMVASRLVDFLIRVEI